MGDQEWELLRFVAGNAPISVGDAATRFGEVHGLARTTVLTVMERLRAKGYLIRRKDDGVFRYSARVSPAEVMRGLIQDFVEKTLSGSVAPFVAYLAESGKLSHQEIEELRRLVDRLPGNSEEPSSIGNLIRTPAPVAEGKLDVPAAQEQP